MVSRRDLKMVHEEAVLRHFAAYLQENDASLEVLQRPEPPEAIVNLNGEMTWIEITDAYLDRKHAIGLTSGAADDVDHVPDDGRLVVDPDAMFSSVLQSVIEAKYDKESMRSIAADLGPGILLVGVFTPFTNAESVARNEASVVADLISRKSTKLFESIYAYDGTGTRSFHLLYRRQG